MVFVQSSFYSALGFFFFWKKQLKNLLRQLCLHSKSAYHNQVDRALKIRWGTYIQQYNSLYKRKTDCMKNAGG